MTLSPTPLTSAHARFDRRQSSVRPRQLLPPSLAAAAARAVADPPLSAALSPFAAAPIACCRHLCRARTRMCEMVRRQGVAHTLSNALERPSCRHCASRHCRLDGPLSNPKRQNARTRQRRAARARRAALTVTRPCQHRSSSHAPLAMPVAPRRALPIARAGGVRKRGTTRDAI